MKNGNHQNVEDLPVLNEVFKTPLIRESSLCPLVVNIQQSHMIASSNKEIFACLVCMQDFVLWPIEYRIIDA
jgi:hypothetical protein